MFGKLAIDAGVEDAAGLVGPDVQTGLKSLRLSLPGQQ
jgi:hypothetical protein